MAALPGGVLFCPRWIAFDSDGEVLPGAKLYSYETGGAFSALQFLYSNSLLTIPLTNPVVADSGGRFAEMFLLPTGYDLKLTDANDVTIWTARDVEDIGQSFLTDLGLSFANGSRDVASGYVVTDSDNLITTDSADTTDPFIIFLQPAADRGFPLAIKHQSAFDLEITPDGAEEIEGIAGAFTIPAASSPTFPTVWIVSDGSGGYFILSSHGV